MVKKWICMFISAGVIFWTAGPGHAAGQTGSIRVLPVCCGAAVTGGSVFISRVGRQAGNGIQVTDGLANWILKEDEILSEDWLDWVLQRSAGEQEQQVTENGAVFSALKEGTYLVQDRSSGGAYSCFTPFLVSVSPEEGWNRLCRPPVIRMEEAPGTSDHPAPIIGAMGIGFSVAVLMVLADGRKK